MLTDEEIIKIAADTKTGEPGLHGYILPISFAREIERAVLEKALAQQDPIGKICKSAECGGVDFYFDKIPYGDTMLYAGPQPAQAAIANGLIDALEQSQYQIDADGSFIGVSRQALDEAIDILKSLSASPKPE